MAKFVLVDSNISGAGGHYLEYAEQVFEAAAAAGYETHLVANRAFQPAERGGNVHQTLPFDVWGRNLALEKDPSNAFTAADKDILRHSFSKLGLLWTAASDLRAVAEYAREVSLPWRAARWLGRICEVRETIEAQEQALRCDGALRPVPASQAEDRAWRDELRREAVRRVTAGRPVRRADPLAIRLMEDAAAAEANARALGAVLEQIGVGDDDTIFVPTLSFSETRGVRDLLARSPAARRPAWALLFRRDLYRGATPEWENQEWQVHAVRTLFNAFHTLPSEVRVDFLTDTDELTRQYDRLGAGAFRTVAIPVRRPDGAADRGAMLQAALRRRDAVRLQVRFLRDPQFEHGLDYLPHILDALPAAILRTIRLQVTEAALGAPPEAAELVALERARLRPYLPDVVGVVDDDAVLSGDIAVLAEPRALDGSLLAAHASDLVRRFRVIVAPVEATVLKEVERARRDAGRKKLTVLTYSEGASGAATARNLAAVLEQAIAALQGQSDAPATGKPPWVMGYLGDARREKGIQVLSHLPEMLEGREVADRAILIYSQLYNAAPAGDVENLLALERLRAAPPGVVLGEARALATADYQALLACSDVVFNLYDRENYRARSSGVFVEALAAHKPVVTTAGSWMSAVMGGLAFAYHQQAIATKRILSEVELGGPASPWRKNTPDGGEERLPYAPAPLTERTIHVTSPIPNRTTHLWIEGDFESWAPDTSVHMVVAWRDRRLQPIREDHLLLNRLGTAPLSVVLEAPREAGNVWIGTWADNKLSLATLTRWRLRWVRHDDDIACLPGGVTIPPFSEREAAKRARDGLLHILERYDAYQASCEWVAARWADEQTAERLVRQVLDPAAMTLQPRGRLIGREW